MKTDERTISLTVKIPDKNDLTEEQIRDWIYFELGYSASLNLQNPLVNDILSDSIISVSIRG